MLRIPGAPAPPPGPPQAGPPPPGAMPPGMMPPEGVMPPDGPLKPKGLKHSLDLVSQPVAGYMGPEAGPFECQRCTHWMDGSCGVVEGQIDPQGICNLFEPDGVPQGDGPPMPPDEDGDEPQGPPMPPGPPQ